MIPTYDVLIIGGGAAGFFAAINCAEMNPNLKIAILERGQEVLNKVRISGGGRCNVTHACYIPNELVKFYPRGEKELRGPFNKFAPGDTIGWFADHGVALKTEEDGRMFPESDQSSTIIECFMTAARKHKIDIITSQTVQHIFRVNDYWKIDTQSQNFKTSHLVLATGSNPKIWDLLERSNHTIVPAVPSLFTFNIQDKTLTEMMGIAVPTSIKIKNSKLENNGPMLITHWGISGPAVLKLSAWGAIELAAKKYQFAILVNWLDHLNTEEATTLIKELKVSLAKKLIGTKSPFEFPKRLWDYLLNKAKIAPETKWADLTKQQTQQLAQTLTASEYQVNGKSTFKEEFVTAGGVHLKEVDFKTMQSKVHENLYFAGEILNIDAITGGFNFQNAWSTAYIAATHIAQQESMITEA